MTREDREGPFEPGVAFTGREAAAGRVAEGPGRRGRAAAGRRNPMRMMRTAGRGRIRSTPSQCPVWWNVSSRKKQNVFSWLRSWAANLVFSWPVKGKRKISGLNECMDALGWGTT